jgi:hypothetical protein
MVDGEPAVVALDKDHEAGFADGVVPDGVEGAQDLVADLVADGLDLGRLVEVQGDRADRLGVMYISSQVAWKVVAMATTIPAPSPTLTWHDLVQVLQETSTWHLLLDTFVSLPHVRPTLTPRQYHTMRAATSPHLRLFYLTAILIAWNVDLPPVDPTSPHAAGLVYYMEAAVAHMTEITKHFAAPYEVMRNLLDRMTYRNLGASGKVVYDMAQGTYHQAGRVLVRKVLDGDAGLGLGCARARIDYDPEGVVGNGEGRGECWGTERLADPSIVEDFLLGDDLLA